MSELSLPTPKNTLWETEQTSEKSAGLHFSVKKSIIYKLGPQKRSSKTKLTLGNNLNFNLTNWKDQVTEKNGSN